MAKVVFLTLNGNHDAGEVELCLWGEISKTSFIMIDLFVSKSGIRVRLNLLVACIWVRDARRKPPRTGYCTGGLEWFSMGRNWWFLTKILPKK